MTLQQLKDKIDQALATGVDSSIPIKVGVDFDGHKTVVDRDLADAELIQGQFVLFREV